MPSILGANSVRDNYQISNTVRFNDDDSAALSITPGTASTSRKKWTWSGWIKRGEVPTDDNNDYSRIFNVKADGNNYFISGFLYSDGFNVTAREGNTQVLKFEPSRKFRDHSAWYHIVMAFDSTQGTARNRFRVYFNGEEDTTALDTTPAENLELVVLEDVIHNIGRDNHGTAYYYDGYMADVYLVDGTQYAASDFGLTDSNGVWIPKKFTGSIGTNGFKLEFQQTGTSQNSSGIGADTGGEDNHLAVTNLVATDVTTDTPTNNFATMNPLDNRQSVHIMSEGNTKFVTNAGGDGPFQTATIGDLTKGKWYFEFKYTDPAHADGGDAAGEFYGQIGICGSGLCAATNAAFSSFEHNFAYDSSNGRIKFNNTAGTVHGSQISADGQIIGFLVDLDNNKVSTHKNGSYADGSGNHDESFGNAAFVNVTAPESTPLGGYFIAFGENISSDEGTNQDTGTYEINFGNPSFAISSSNADANGHGNFEYAVPSGYFALCTKNLAEFG